MKQKNYPLYETTFFTDLREMIDNVANRYPNKVALAYKTAPHDTEVQEITFSQVKDDVTAYGTSLLEMGCQKKRCAIVGAASYGWIYTYFALTCIGAVTVPIDKDLPLAEMESILETSECEYIFYGVQAKDTIAEVKKINKFAQKYICIYGGDLEEDTVDKLVSHGKDLIEQGNASFKEVKINPEELASIVFTSGTTGSGKGVMLSQKNICSDMVQGMYVVQMGTNTMMLLPPHHTYGSTVNIIGQFCQGCRIYITSGFKYMLKEFKEQKPTHLILVPLFIETIYKRIWQTAEKEGKEKLLRRMIKVSNGMRKVGIDLRRKMFASITDMFGGNLEFIVSGGAGINQEIVDTFDAIGITILNGYGITECAPLVSVNRNEWQKRGSAGYPIIGEQVKIDKPDKNGEGEICVKGPNIMMGYYKNEEATKNAFTKDGYFRTGDFGRIDEDGWIFITGRIKNLIILSNGKNVYPEEIESEISRIYGVNEVVVYAGESKTVGKEVIVAEIYPDKDSLANRGITDLQQYFNDEVKKVNDRMVAFKAVQLVKIRETEFIKNTSKKIVRFKIDKKID